MYENIKKVGMPQWSEADLTLAKPENEAVLLRRFEIRYLFGSARDSVPDGAGGGARSTSVRPRSLAAAVQGLVEAFGSIRL